MTIGTYLPTLQATAVRHAWSEKYSPFQAPPDVCLPGSESTAPVYYSSGNRTAQAPEFQCSERLGKWVRKSSIVDSSCDAVCLLATSQHSGSLAGLFLVVLLDSLVYSCLNFVSAVTKSVVMIEIPSNSLARRSLSRYTKYQHLCHPSRRRDITRSIDPPSHSASQ